MTESQEIAVGNELIDMLGLKVRENGRVDTLWGSKTPLGIYRSIRRIIHEAEAANDLFLNPHE